MPNAFHRLGDAASAFSSRVQFAWAAFTGRLPLPTPLERLKLMTIIADIAAIKATETARAALDAQKDQAVADATAAAEAATAKLDALTKRVDDLVATVGVPTDAGAPIVVADPAPAALG
jgi:hypothetical protein